MKNLFIFFLITPFFISILSFTQETNSVNTENLDTNIIDTNFLDDYYIGTDDPTPEPEPIESPAIAFLRIMLITGILALLTWLTIKFFFRRNALSLSMEGKSIEILATVPAGLGSYFLITKLHNLYYLCALSTDGLRLLDKITDQEAIDFIELNRVQTLPQDIKFVDLLENIPDGKPKQALEFLREKINQLKKK